MIKLLKKYISLFLIGSVLMIPCCSPIAFSPNAQNEMVTPVDYVGEKQEVGGV